MGYLPNFIFLILLAVGGGFFTRNIFQIRRNILLGKDADRNDRKSKRWGHMLRIAFGQSKMGTKPLAAFLHFVVYIGFVLINIELL